MQNSKINNWDKGILIAWGIACLLIISWIFPVTRMLWDFVDGFTYLFLHSYFLQTDFSQKFWAVMNSRIADNFSHAIFILILVRYIFVENGQEKKKKLRKVMFVLVSVVVSVLISKGVQSELSKHYSIKRDSPSLVLGHEVALSEVLPGLENVKDASRRSFPGDHAMTIVLLCGFIFWLTKSFPFRIVAVVVGLFFIMPRLISGGHWLTDLIMGSLPIAIFALMVWTGFFRFVKSSLLKRRLTA